MLPSNTKCSTSYGGLAPLRCQWEGSGRQRLGGLWPPASPAPRPRKGSMAGLGGEAMRRQLVAGSAVTRVHELLRSEDELHRRATEGSPCLQHCGDLPSREKLLPPLRLQVTREEDGVSKPWTLGGRAARAPTQASEEGDCWVGLGLCTRTLGPVSVWFCKCQRNISLGIKSDVAWGTARMRDPDRTRNSTGGEGRRRRTSALLSTGPAGPQWARWPRGSTVPVSQGRVRKGATGSVPWGASMFPRAGGGEPGRVLGARPLLRTLNQYVVAS